MKYAVRALLALLGLVVGLVAVQQIAAEGIEVVVLHTVDDAGEPRDTRIWILEEGGKTYLRGGPGGWTSRVLASPEVVFDRGGRPEAVLGVLEASDDVRRRVNRGFRAKYGWRDTVISWMLLDPEREGSVVIEARPRSS